ncbi:MAG: hypothetical protein ABR600_11565 [Actinomycetota bacterium]
MRATLMLLLLASAVLFAVGAAVERHHHSERTSTEAGGHVEGGDEGGGESHHVESGSPEPSSEKLLGIDPEAPWIVAIGVAVSVLLAAAVWAVRRGSVLMLAVVLGLAFAALDLREMVHQIHESRPSLMTVSIVLAVLHFSVTAVAAILVRKRPMRPRTA